MEIIKVFKERIQKARLIGKRYVDKDRAESGSYGHKWEEFFKDGRFTALEKVGALADFDYLGVMRVLNGEFEYWIGMLFKPDALVPEGYDYFDFDGFDAGVCWIYGNPDNGELYGEKAHEECLRRLVENEWKSNCDKGGLSIERYNCPRFLSPDEKGNVILDYYIELK